ncbi:MAG TPA: nodulation protein NfeD [Thermomicrobiales bacterium]|nr:nodulation protein NfeD [Thermomicrobiales bacterium]
MTITRTIQWSVRLAALLLVAAGLLVTPLAAQESAPRVTRLDVDGPITPVMATYIDRGLDAAAKRGDDAVIIRMDTPGGLSSAMDDIIADILASPVPVIVWVGPEGARAASAGMYIAYAAHVAAMAPVTNIGSATPINLGGDDDDSELSASDRKVINDAVARVRALAELRGRNGDWAEEAVRDAANVGAREAVELNVVDFIANDIEDALSQADGREVLVGGQTVRLRTEGATVRDVEMSFFEKLLQVIVDPNVAFVLLSLGTLGLIFELSNPGAIFPGVAGAIMVIVGFYALGTLESNTAGLVLIALAFAMFVLEVFVVSGGVLTVGGIVMFVLGGLLLSNTRNPEVLQISRAVIFTTAILIGLFFFFVVGSVVKTRGKTPATGRESFIGREGVARSDLDPRGRVFVDGTLWSAEAVGEPVILKGEPVRVVGRDGMLLHVERITAEELLDERQAEGTSEALVQPRIGQLETD